MTNNDPFKKFRRQLEAVVNERANRIANQLTAEVVEVFANRAKKRLEQASTDFVPETASIINSLKENITVEKQDLSTINKTTGKKKEKIYASVKVKRDPQNLLMFLEYGTGIEGSYNEHPEAGSVGWKYVIHPENYRHAEKLIPNLKYNQMGWFFTKRPMSVIKRDDHQNIVVTHKKFQEVRPYIRNGKPVKSYIRKIKAKPDRIISNSVFTQGIKPVRFIYDTKQELKNLFKATKGSYSVEEFYSKLRALENK